ncbi:MAG: SDR family oxidoreductase [Pseudomonadota bacterium]
MSRLAIITGASAGIGAATARRLLADGWRVINLSRRPCPVDGVESLQTDLAEAPPRQLVETLRTACAESERVAVVHNAGLLASDNALGITTAQLHAALQVNVVAPAALNAAIIDALPAGSAIVFIGSTLGDKAVGGALSYATSKHAVHGLMRATCQDLAGTGVHTAVVAPGFTDTEMLRDHVGGDSDILDAIASGVTFGRLIEPEEIAATIVFCIDNAVINGAVIHANLGQIER